MYLVNRGNEDACVQFCRSFNLVSIFTKVSTLDSTMAISLAWKPEFHIPSDEELGGKKV